MSRFGHTLEYDAHPRKEVAVIRRPDAITIILAPHRGLGYAASLAGLILFAAAFTVRAVDSAGGWMERGLWLAGVVGLAVLAVLYWWVSRWPDVFHVTPAEFHQEVRFFGRNTVKRYDLAVIKEALLAPGSEGETCLTLRRRGPQPPIELLSADSSIRNRRAVEQVVIEMNNALAHMRAVSARANRADSRSADTARRIEPTY
jgi:hypothetical protein